MVEDAFAQWKIMAVKIPYLSNTSQRIWSISPSKRESIAQRFDESQWARVFSGIVLRVFRLIQWTLRSCKNDKEKLIQLSRAI